MQRIARKFLDRCVLRPTRHTIDRGVQLRAEVPVNHRGGQLIESFVHFSGTSPENQRSNVPFKQLAERPKPRWLLLKFPGTAGRAERSTDFPANLSPVDTEMSPQSIDYEVWTWNPPGYGGSPGRASLAGYVPAAQQWLATICQARANRQTSVWLCGNSLGCLPPLWCAAHANTWLPSTLDPAQLNLWIRNPPVLREVIIREARRYRTDWWMRSVTNHLPETTDAIRSAENCDVPAVYLTCELDSLVLPEWQRQIQQAHRGPSQLIMLDGLDHGDMLEERHRASLDQAAGWLWDASGENESSPCCEP